MNKFKLFTLILLLALPGIECLGLEPFECVLIANRKSNDSMTLANFYADLRGIPDENVVHIEIDEKFYTSPFTMSLEDFKQLVYNPVADAIAERGIEGVITAWIYSTDLPLRIKIEENTIISILGATLTAKKTPSADQVRKAQYQSPLYAGPSPAQDALHTTRSFDRILAQNDGMQGYPSMMLSFTQSGGLDLPQSKDVLRRGKIADASAPEGTVFFVKTEDQPRSKPREWQFEPAADILRQSGVNAIIADAPPSNESDIIGLQIGIQRLDTREIGTFLPGAMAEHMTSWGASFDRSGHTRVTDWLAAGATASSGTVTEPYALWPKFPTAFFFHHYRSGATIIESFYQSILSPMQILLLGDPLARPWARTPNITVINLEQSDQITGQAHFFARMFQTIDPRLEPKYEFHLNGNPIASGLADGQIGLDTNRIPDGHHRLRAVISTRAPVNIKPSGKVDFVSNNRGRVPVLEGIEDNQQYNVADKLKMRVVAPETATSVGLRSRFLVLAESESHESEFNIKVESLGLGKIPIQAFARYEDGETSFSPPLRIKLNDNAR